MEQRFLPAHRLRSQVDFDRVYKRRCSASNAAVLVFADENGLEHPRLGLSVSRKVGNAVARNRWKRLLREAFRTGVALLPAGTDLIVVPRAAEPPPLERLQLALCDAARRAVGRLRRARPAPGAERRP